MGNLSLKEALHRYEAHFIEMALKDSNGRVTQAANLLGLPGHQALLFMLQSRHKNLSEVRTPIAPRRRSIIGDRDATSKAGKRANNKTRKIKILHVEDDIAVSNMIEEALVREGWEVETCADGSEAMKKIAGHAHYDLLLLDYELPGVNGVRLAQEARRLAHRQQTPIIILSATLDAESVQRAGADVFLRKPEDIMAVGRTVSRLLQQARR